MTSLSQIAWDDTVLPFQLDRSDIRGRVARLDGMGELRILYTVFWPLAKAPLATVGILTFMGAWNEVLWPLLVVRDEQLMTLPQLLTVFSLGGGAGPRRILPFGLRRHRVGPAGRRGFVELGENPGQGRRRVEVKPVEAAINP